MRTTTGMLGILGAMAACSTAPALHAQTAAAKAAGPALRACSLLTNAEIAKATGEPLHEEPFEMRAACEYGSGSAVVRIFAGKDPQQQVAATLAAYQKQDAKKHPVSGLGTGAYIMYPKPRDQYEDTIALVVLQAGTRMLMITLAAPDGKPAESMQAALVSLAKVAQARAR